MTSEKILAFFNFSIEQCIDKSIMKILFWFDFGFTVFIIIGGLLTRVFQGILYSILFILIFIFLDILFGFWLKLSKNPAQEFLYNAVVSTTSCLKLIYGARIFSVLKNENLDILHIIVLLFFVLLALLIVFKKHMILKDLETNTIEQARKNITKKTKGIGPIIIPIPATAVIAFMMSRIFSRTFHLGLGFILWVLASIWIFFSICFLYNMVIAKKYKVANIFSKSI